MLELADGLEMEGLRTLDFPNGEALVLGRKNRRVNYEDAMAIGRQRDAVFGMVCDGVSSVEGSGELAAVLVRRGMERARAMSTPEPLAMSEYALKSVISLDTKGVAVGFSFVLEEDELSIHHFGDPQFAHVQGGEFKVGHRVDLLPQNFAWSAFMVGEKFPLIPGLSRLWPFSVLRERSIENVLCPEGRRATIARFMASVRHHSPKIEPHVSKVELSEGDCFVMGSDGLELYRGREYYRKMFELWDGQNRPDFVRLAEEKIVKKGGDNYTGIFYFHRPSMR